MADDKAIRATLKEKTGWSTESLANRVTALTKKQLMPRAHALYVLAHRAGIKLESFSVDDTTLIEVGKLSAEGSAPEHLPAARRQESPESASGVEPGQTAASRFALRDLHPRVVQASRKAFNNGLSQSAVHKALQSVNNRVKRLTNTTRDGYDVMGWAFSDNSPQLQMTSRSTESEENEHAGLRFVMQGAMRGMRNPRAHEDHWEPDEDEAAVLELLSFASYLHRCLDRCEAYAAGRI